VASSVLSREAWDSLVNEIIIPAFGPQLEPEKFNPHAAWVGAQLIADKWTVSRTRWALTKAAKVYRKLDNLLAMLCHVDAGDRDRDGNIVGGWESSAVHLAESREYHDANSRKACYDACRDFPDYPPGCQRGKSYCGECPGVQRRTGSQTGGGFNPLSDLLPKTQSLDIQPEGV
jgi:hypothetical protein